MFALTPSFPLAPVMSLLGHDSGLRREDGTHHDTVEYNNRKRERERGRGREGERVSVFVVIYVSWTSHIDARVSVCFFGLHQPHSLFYLHLYPAHL